MRFGPAWYRGTADAVLQNLNLIDDFNPDVVAIFGADHIYRMDVNQMLAFHEETGADVTVAARSMPRADASVFGVLGVDRQSRVVDFVEKPKNPPAMPGDPDRALVSMGNYLFRRQALVDALLVDARRSTDHDFGRSIIPELVPGARVYGYDFQANEVPGVKPYEEQGYWRDVGSLPSYWEAHMDLLGESPRFDLDNRYWPVRTGAHPGPPARFIGSDVDNAHVGEASLVKRATIRNSILGRSVWVNEGAVIGDSAVMDLTTVGNGTRLRRAICGRSTTGTSASRRSATRRTPPRAAWTTPTAFSTSSTTSRRSRSTSGPRCSPGSSARRPRSTARSSPRTAPAWPRAAATATRSRRSTTT